MTLNEKAPGPTQRELSVACSQCADVSPVEVCVSVAVSVRVCIGLGGLIDFGEGDGCVSTGERVLRVIALCFHRVGVLTSLGLEFLGAIPSSPLLVTSREHPSSDLGPAVQLHLLLSLLGRPPRTLCPSPGKG